MLTLPGSVADCFGVRPAAGDEQISDSARNCIHLNAAFDKNWRRIAFV
jgi:hypothetical protein